MDAAPAGVPPREMIDRLASAANKVWTKHSHGRMAWRLWGQGPPLMLLHGGHGSWMHWCRNVAPLARRFRLFVPDLPGYGESDAFPMQMTAQSVTAAVLAGWDELVGNATDFTVVGFSFGGVLAGYLSAARNRHARTVILVGTGGLPLRSEPRPQFVRWKDLAPGPERDAAHRANLGAFMLHDPASVDTLAVTVQTYGTERARARPNYEAFVAQYPQALAQIRGQLVGVWGEFDVTAAPHLAQRRAYLAGIHANARVHVVANAGHWVQYEQPAAFHRIVMGC